MKSTEARRKENHLADTFFEEHEKTRLLGERTALSSASSLQSGVSNTWYLDVLYFFSLCVTLINVESTFSQALELGFIYNSG